MEELTHMVQYRRKTGVFDLGWHTMAAFDSEFIADRYVRECMDDGNTFRADYEYRVQEIAR